MDFNLKQWGNRQHESEEQQPPLSAKIPKFLQSRPDHQPPSGSVSELPLFVSEPNGNLTSNLSAFPDLTTGTRFPRTGSLSLAQWQELELQALIFRYMLVGAAVPAELLVPIKKSLLLNNIASPSYYPHHPLQHYPHNYQSASLLQSWGRGAMDPEPGRCRRTDGKKWRCSRDILMGHKYCERHVHRGRNRSRKPVEFPIPSIPSGAGAGGRIKTAIPIAAPPLTAVGDEPNFGLSGTSPSVDLLHLNQSSRSENSKSLFEHQVSKKGSENERSDGQILRHFLDDWPRSLQEPDSNAECLSNGNPQKSTSTTSLSMSTSENLSDISLKLSTGTEDEPGNSQREPSRLNWASGWGTNQVPSMGGPLAEALRSSSTSNSSPTSVLHELPPCSASEMSYAST